MSVFPMFSQAGRPWARVIVRELNATEPLSWDTLQTPTALPGRPFPLNETDLDPVDLADFVMRTDLWEAPRRQALQRLFGAALEGRHLLIVQVRSFPSSNGIQLYYIPLPVLTTDTIQVHPKWQP